MQGPRQGEKINRVRLLFLKYEGRLLRYCMRMVTEQMAREVVQDTFLKLWQHENGLSEDHIAQWLYTVCRNQCIDIVRRDKKMKPVQIEDEQIASTSDPAGDLEAARWQRLAYELIESLPAKEQEVIRLKFQENLSYQQISSITGLTVSYVGVMIHKALLQLREAYKQLEETKEAL